MAEIETVRIKSAETPFGYLIINESDFVDGVDVLFDEPSASTVERKRGKKASASSARAEPAEQAES